MYIWILLATIMVALSFFNTSPREDKASVFTEIKASTFINRFRAEHIAYFRTMECEIILNPTHSLDDSKAVIEAASADYVNYTSVQKNLPIGYRMIYIALMMTCAVIRLIMTLILKTACTQPTVIYFLTRRFRNAGCPK